MANAIPIPFFRGAGVAAPELGIIVVDHGSRRDESNRKLLEFVEMFRGIAPCRIVEPAHMELASPSIAEAFDRCVERGATRVVVSPFFLLPGRHWQQDIPQLAAAAAARHSGVEYLVAAPLGLHPLLAQALNDRIHQCLEHATGHRDSCDLCAGTDACQLRGNGGQ